MTNTSLVDLIRFNEAVDQAIAESVTSYSFEKEQEVRVFDTILSSSPDLSFTFRLDSKFSYGNKALLDLLELTPEKIIGKGLLDLGFPNAAELNHELDRVISTKKQIRGEMPYTSPSGDNVFFEYIFVPVLDHHGSIEMIAGTARNITEAKRMRI